MALHWVVLLFTLVCALEAAIASAQALPGCSDRCGNVSIPYPFGIREGCYIQEEFLITCNDTFNPPKAFLTTGNINVTNIWLSGQLRILSYVAQDCYNKTGHRSGNNQPWMRFAKFPISNTRNKFTAVGCDTIAVIEGSRGQIYTTGCLSLCSSINNVINGSCSGIGCCQTTLPKGIRGFDITVNGYYNHSSVSAFNPCSYAFVVEDETYNFSSIDLFDLQNKMQPQVILDWAIGGQNCSEAKKNLTSYACKGNSECYDSDNGPGYRCNCLKGFQGNPYLPSGCQDIDECVTSSPCSNMCQNLPGSFKCTCPPGFEGDGKINGTRCNPISKPEPFSLINIALGVSISLLVLLLGISWLYWGLRHRKHMKIREKFFQQNGGIMLQQQLSKHEGSVEAAKIFTAEELKKATNNYHESRVLGQGGQGTVYKGMLPDNKIVAIKKSKIVDQGQVEQFINEVIVLSQVNHRNVVKLLGCCLETQVPLLVYEFVTNGTLFHHIHAAGHASSIPWETRLRIAAETAGALSYLHSAASTPIIHRNIKSTNILLDDNLTAKVADFGASRLIPLDQTQLATLVQGTLGYLDPEYFRSSQLTEKSDVYSFGVVLVELLTGKKALSFERPEQDRNLANYFTSSIKEDRLFELIDPRVLSEGKNTEQLKEVAKLANRCLRVNREKRPTMKEVAIELEGLRVMTKHPWVKDDLNSEETEYLLGEPSGINVGSKSSNVAGYDSIKNEVKMAFDDGR